MNTEYIHKRLIALHLKCLNSCFQSALTVKLSHAYRKVDRMSGRISLALEAREMFLSSHIAISLEKADVIWLIMKSTPGFDPSLEVTDPRYLKLSNSSRFWSFYLELSLLLFLIFTLYLVSSGLTTISSAKRKLMMIRPPVLILLLWSSNASLKILSRRIRKSRHPY